MPGRKQHWTAPALDGEITGMKFLTPALLAVIAVLLALILRRMPVMPATVGELDAARRTAAETRDVESRAVLVKVREGAEVFVTNRGTDAIPVVNQ